MIRGFDTTSDRPNSLFLSVRLTLDAIFLALRRKGEALSFWNGTFLGKENG